MSRLVQRRRKRVAPYGRNAADRFAALDRRTAEGKLLADVEEALLEQIPDPTAAQRFLVRHAAIKMVRCELLARLVFGPQPADKPITDNREYHLLSWSNGFRRDLLALGLLDPVQRPIDPLAHLHAYITARDGDAA